MFTTSNWARTRFPRPFSQNVFTPFTGIGCNTLGLPSSFPAAGTSSMPLSTGLHSVALGSQRKRLALQASVVALDNLSLRLEFERDVREGQHDAYGSFFSSASELAAAVDPVHDQLEVSAAFTTGRWQAMLAYQIWRFHNGLDALTWFSPFWPVLPGATRDQLAQAPDNLLQQFSGSAGFDITPGLRASADIAFGHLALTEKITVGLGLGYARDDYGACLIGLQNARTETLGGDVAAALTESTRLTLFAQTERMGSGQTGSQQRAAADRTAQNKDRSTVVGLGVKHAVIPDNSSG